MFEDKAIFVAGHRGLVGSAIRRKLKSEGCRKILVRSRDELNLTNQSAVEKFFAAEKPEIVILAAGKVGGIQANEAYPADFIRENLLIQTNVIDAAYRYGTEKFIFLGSSCIYPKFAPQPIKEEYLLTSALEPTNEAYAVAKIAGVKMCQFYRRQYGFNGICLMPTNLYGPNDNFDLADAHVLPALIRKFHEAKLSGAGAVVVWGTGTPKREFLHADDLAAACFFLLKTTPEAIDAVAADGLINVGTGKDVTIYELALMIKQATGFQGKIEFDSSKPDGTQRKLLDIGRMSRFGWKAAISLREGISQTSQWYAATIQQTIR